MSNLKSRPVILCGQSEAIARVVIEQMKPEYEVIHLVLNGKSGCNQIPLILAGRSAPSDTTLGTQDYTRPPVAVVSGAAWSAEVVGAMMKACEASDTAIQVPWLRAGEEKGRDMPPLGPAYGKAIVVRVKQALNEITDDRGEMKQKGEVVFY